MNTKQVLIAMAVAATMTATGALAQTAPTAPTAAAPAATAPADSAKGKGRHEMKFEDRKAHALQRLEKSAARIQQKQACVQASTDKASLQACFPKRGQGSKGGWHKHGGKGAGKADTGGAASTPDAAPEPAEQ